jgi:hypothetical protein
LFFVAVAIAAVAVSCGDGDETGDGESGGTSGSVSSSTNLFAGIDTDLITRLTGSTTTTEQITLEPGLLLMHAESDGGFFAVNLVQDTGNELLFNETVKYSGSNAIRIDEYLNPIGLYLTSGPAALEITSSSNYTISYTQAAVKTGISPILDISGSLDHVVPSIDFAPGNYTITASNDVEFANFSIVLLRREKPGHQLLINASNPIDKTKEFEIKDASSVVNPAGLWALVIGSTGNWEVSIK